MNCWEFMRCGREAGGRNVDRLGICPAYPEDGQRCATVVGTFCDLVKALYATRHSGCPDCPFFNSIHFDVAAKTAILEKKQNKGAPGFTEAPL
jgi:hypothetical protein